MYGELTDKEAISKTDHSFEAMVQEQVEILLYKKNSKYKLIDWELLTCLTAWLIDGDTWDWVNLWATYCVIL